MVLAPRSNRFRHYLLLRNSPDTTRAEWGFEGTIPKALAGRRMTTGSSKPLLWLYCSLIRPKSPFHAAAMQPMRLVAGRSINTYKSDIMALNVSGGK